MFMDENEMPVSFGRLYVIIKEATKKSESDKAMLTPSQIRDLTSQAIKERPIKSVSKQFCNSLTKFMDSLAQKVERLIFGNMSDDDDTTNPLAAGSAFLRNFDFLTQA